MPATVSQQQRRDGAVVPQPAVVVGDELRVAAGADDAAWSRVHMSSKRVVHGGRPFVELTTTSGAALTATASHLASGALVPAGDMAVGDALEVVDAATSEAVSRRPSWPPGRWCGRGWSTPTPSRRGPGGGWGIEIPEQAASGAGAEGRGKGRGWEEGSNPDTWHWYSQSMLLTK